MQTNSAKQRLLYIASNLSPLASQRIEKIGIHSPSVDRLYNRLEITAIRFIINDCTSLTSNAKVFPVIIPSIVFSIVP